MSSRSPGQSGDDWVVDMFEWFHAVNESVQQQDQTLRELFEAQDDLLSQQMAELERLRQEVEGEERNAYPFDFSLNIPANTPRNTPSTVVIEIPFDARIMSLTVIWPPGAENRAGAQLRRETGERLFPRDDDSEYIAADDFGDEFRLRADVAKGDELVAEYINNDTQNSHFINMIAEIEQRGPE